MPEPSTTTGTTSTTGLTDLTLTVRIDGLPEQEVFLQHGLSLGRNLSNTICVNNPQVERIHAMVCRQGDGTMLLECTEPHLKLTLPGGSQVQQLPLLPGTTFMLGGATLRCLQRQLRPTVLISDNPWSVRCPRCHDTIAGLPRESGHCPKCQLEIQFFQSHTGPAGDTTSGRSPGAFEGWLPRQIGPYHIRAFVAQGGMGIILRGLHSTTDLPAAVKLLKVNSDEDQVWRARFLAEIATLRTLRHPNVVRLQDHGSDDKLLWLAMDWIEGQSLARFAATCRADGHEIPIDEIRQIITQIVTGLEYLHGKQIVHRDLKPSNVLIAQDSLVKLVDFGIARGPSGQTSMITQLTHTGMVTGTESYMSPEQAQGQTVTPASDIYALGVMWYEMVTGRRPLGAFMAPSTARPECPPAWSNMIGKSLQSIPQMRPSLAAIAAALTSITAEQWQPREQRWDASSEAGAVPAPIRQDVATAARAGEGRPPATPPALPEMPRQQTRPPRQNPVADNPPKPRAVSVPSPAVGEDLRPLWSQPINLITLGVAIIMFIFVLWSIFEDRFRYAVPVLIFGEHMVIATALALRTKGRIYVALGILLLLCITAFAPYRYSERVGATTVVLALSVIVLTVIAQRRIAIRVIKVLAATALASLLLFRLREMGIVLLMVCLELVLILSARAIQQRIRSGAQRSP